MASLSMAVMTIPITSLNKQPSSSSIFNPLQKPTSAISSCRKFSKLQVKASMKEKAMVAATSAAVTASMVVPQIAEAASGSPSLKNFLLSIVSGGVVLTAIIGAVVGVSYFDPVKRG